MKTLCQYVVAVVQLKAMVKFGQNKNIHGILEVSILSSQLVEDTGGTPCEQGFYTSYSLFPLCHLHVATVGSRD
jgi:hypothetical protein